jgi:hypothetical protein
MATLVPLDRRHRRQDQKVKPEQAPKGRPGPELRSFVTDLVVDGALAGPVQRDTSGEEPAGRTKQRRHEEALRGGAGKSIGR